MQLGVTGNVQFVDGITQFVATTPDSNPARFDKASAATWGVGLTLTVELPY